jgi:hypothetical protein
MGLLFLEDPLWATWPPGLIKIEWAAPSHGQQQLRSCQERTVHQSAVQPHGVLRCEIKLHRSNSKPRKEDNERARQKGKQRMEMNTKRYKESTR